MFGGQHNAGFSIALPGNNVMQKIDQLRLVCPIKQAILILDNQQFA